MAINKDLAGLAAASLADAFKYNSAGMVQAKTHPAWHTPEQMIAMRMHIAQGDRLPFAYLSAHVTSSVALVFLVKDNKGVVLSDDPALFPSDRLISQLHLLKG